MLSVDELRTGLVAGLWRALEKPDLEALRSKPHARSAYTRHLTVALLWYLGAPRKQILTQLAIGSTFRPLAWGARPDPGAGASLPADLVVTYDDVATAAEWPIAGGDNHLPVEITQWAILIHPDILPNKTDRVCTAACSLCGNLPILVRLTTSRCKIA